MMPGHTALNGRRPHGSHMCKIKSEDDTSTLELFTHNQSARDAVDHARRVKTLTGGAVAETAA